MGVSCSCPFAVYCDLENCIESVAVKSIEDERITTARSISFNEKDPEPTRLQSQGSGSGSSMGRKACSLSSPKHEAAIKLQKVYKSFRTRRKLADCAVLIEQSWWKLLDFAELKHSSISFFDLDKHETAISRWSRARTRAAKVGKGLSKNSKAQKLALQHWLEAIDPRHRYGHNLHIYYVKWLNSQSKEPFFYWLDIGEGKEVNLIDKCPRAKLQQQCIKYLGPMERKAYEVVIENGKLIYKQTGQLLHTTDEPKGSKWIFVLSTSRTLYVAKKKKGSFQHSSFLAGGATLAAGRVVAEKGILKAVWPHSGHYRPTPENFQDFISFLRENNVDLTDVKLDSIDDEEESVVKNVGAYLRSNSSEDDLTEKGQLVAKQNDTEDSSPDKITSGEENDTDMTEVLNSRMSHSFIRTLTNLQIPSNDHFIERLKNGSEADERNTSNYPLDSPLDGYETALAFEFDSGIQKNDDATEETISEEAILQRINSHKEAQSYQLGKQLSCKWSSGAGPRIGCLRDYPSKLQCHALEQVNLSPRSKRRLRIDFPSRSSTPNSRSFPRSSTRLYATHSGPM